MLRLLVILSVAVLPAVAFAAASIPTPQLPVSNETPIQLGVMTGLVVLAFTIGVWVGYDKRGKVETERRLKDAENSIYKFRNALQQQGITLPQEGVR